MWSTSIFAEFFVIWMCVISQSFLFSSLEERKDTVYCKQSLKEEHFLNVPSHLAKLQNLQAGADFSFDRTLYRIIVNVVSIMFWLDIFLDET